ncbi:methyltransferase domain-containing protein [Actinomycetes bacterium KLBMP 9759]
MDLETAFGATDVQHYWQTPGGEQFPQSSRCEVVHRVLELLELGTGLSVFEIGTGSGMSTAVLSRAVGPAGSVYSVDADPEVVARARVLLAGDGRANVEVVLADGEVHEPARAPFDRLVAWASCARRVPAAWMDSVRDGGLMVVPLLERREAVTFRVRGGGLQEVGAAQATFIPLSREPSRPWEGAPSS